MKISMQNRRKIKYKNKAPKKHYKMAFDLLMEIALRDLNMPPKMIRKFDEVADYLGETLKPSK